MSFKIIAYEINYGYPANRSRTIPGYKLENGTILLDSERDTDGSYIGGAGMDGMYIKTPARYTPIYDGNTITAFKEAGTDAARQGRDIH